MLEAWESAIMGDDSIMLAMFSLRIGDFMIQVGASTAVAFLACLYHHFQIMQKRHSLLVAEVPFGFHVS